MHIIKRVLLLAIAFTLVTNAYTQLPEFTPVDTGGIYNPGQSRVHVSAIIADFDNDGDLDPVISNIGIPNVNRPTLTLYKNERQGLYKKRDLLREYKNAFMVNVTSPFGDIDNDGDIDVIGQKYNYYWLGVFTNDGYSNFTSETRFNLPFSLSDGLYPVLFDYNKDGFLDLVHFDTCLSIMPNNGEGQFLEPEHILYQEGISKNLIFHGISWGDVDNDGDMDYYLGTSLISKNIFFINTGTGLERMEENHVTLSDTASTPCVNWIDYDNDGDLDLFVDNVSFDTVHNFSWSLYENIGNLEFVKHILDDNKFVGTHSNSSVWGDIDNDGDLDLFISVENNPFPIAPALGHVSTHPYNVLYLNNGDGQFTNIFDHTLTTTDSHTAKLFDHDNDGDLDVLMVRFSWAVDGHNQLYINEGNSNTSISLNCIDRNGCATPFGTRIYAKTKINEKDVSQMREITPVNGHLSFGKTRVHFGLGDAETIDSLIIRWPSSHIDTILNVPANQFYRAIEDSTLLIDYKARNFIQLNPGFAEVEFSETGESVNIDMKDHYTLIVGDTIPDIVGDTLEFIIHSNENPDAVNAALNGGVLTLNAGSQEGTSTIQVIASAGFTQRMDQFTVSSSVPTPSIQTKQSINIFPNPVIDIFHIELKDRGEYLIDISSINGQYMHGEKFQGTSLQIDLSSYQKGVYFITIRSVNFVSTRKIIKL